jgi:L,D-peptidoglycan transpeptidase YkuD (ErfK/YbiS/YcfS/YnhG family)
MILIWPPRPCGSGICLVEFVYQGGFLSGPGLRFRAACGRAGVTAHKREGDGATPAGMLRLLRVYYRADRCKIPRCAVPVEPIGPDDGWCDDPADPAYNKPVHLPHPARAESLWRNEPIYDITGVLGWNTARVVPHLGSAIFLHLATRDYAPTDGCIALAQDDLLACLAAGLTAIRVV